MAVTKNYNIPPYLKTAYFFPVVLFKTADKIFKIVGNLAILAPISWPITHTIHLEQSVTFKLLPLVMV
jgi:hypothetical protein